MADYYELWSTVIGDLTTEEFKWFDLELKQIAHAINKEDESELPSYLRELGDVDIDFMSVPDISLTESEDVRKVWLHSDGASGDRLDVHAAIMQAFLAARRPKEVHQIHWSAGCSRPIADEAYGGGCAVITANEVFFMTTWTWAEEKLKELGFEKEGDRD